MANGGVFKAALREAGYSNDKRGSYLPHRVRDAIQARLADEFAEARVTAPRILHETALIAFADAANYFDADGSFLGDSIPPELSPAIKQASVVEEVSPDGTITRRITLVLHDKLKALKMLGDQHRMFPELRGVVVQHQGPGGGPVQVDVSSDRDARVREIVETVRVLGGDAEEAVVVDGED